MPTRSVFCAECVCGRYFETEAREFVCPNCKRVIVLEWGLADEEPPEPNREAEVAS
jgi:hypothetical protein